jgi:hypothetical protein
MALEQIFSCPKTLARLQNGPLGGLLEGFCLWLMIGAEGQGNRIR